MFVYLFVVGRFAGDRGYRADVGQQRFIIEPTTKHACMVKKMTIAKRSECSSEN